ncbi:MAG: transcriptional repressor [Proteobacteria bacterium]|jgi:Fur family ferric uptake transcriptional regulator|nr:transcriptional repressor [Desulfocapsa sp.]MBU3945408.1 transcriptional repressor [Pseudomonadota bacterium]MCG2744138.1 transcriptional repressor [Desulfobacteraceae bacterium]MDO8947491.1 transcriptional repressor [Desulfocapsaceae bacterium]MBU4028140.1 transcriptional repressor [Pseudomonadota bacterium]
MQEHNPMRITTQRQIILEELLKVTSHPTANEVYDMVRKRLPRIGLGTVYRNLELMSETGMILKLEVGGTQKRFDATVTPHYHVRCMECGKVNDIKIPIQHDINELAAKACHYQILGHHIEFTGLCSDCGKSSQQKTSIN